MYIEQLIIKNNAGIIRDIPFKKGVNLITTPPNDKTKQNGVGKSTVLDFIDILMGAKVADKKKKFSNVVKEIIDENGLKIQIKLKNDKNKSSYTLAYDFKKSRNKYAINLTDMGYDEYKEQVKEILFPDAPSELKLRHLIKLFFSFKLTDNEADTIRYLDEKTNEKLETYELLYIYFLNKVIQNEKLSQLMLYRTSQREDQKILDDKKIKIIEVPSVFKESIENMEGYDENNQLFIEYQKAVDHYQEYNLELNLIDEEYEKHSDELDEEVVNLIINELGELIPNVTVAFEKIIQFNKVREDNRKAQLHRKREQLILKLESLKTQIEAKENKMVDYINFQKDENVFNFDTYNSILQDKFAVKLKEKFSKPIEIEPPISDIDALISEEHIANFNNIFKKLSKDIMDLEYSIERNLEWTIKKTNIPILFSQNHGSATGDLHQLVFCFAFSIITINREKQFPEFILQDINEVKDTVLFDKMLKVATTNNIQLIIPILGSKLPEKYREEYHIALELATDNKLLEPKNKIKYE